MSELGEQTVEVIRPRPRGRAPLISDADIRRVAREQLRAHGAEALTLRAIARELGITAPALYRHYASREELLDALRLEFCADLAAELTADLAALPDDGAVQFFAICRGFRRWALAHTREFAVVFASPGGTGASVARRFGEPFGRVFLAAAGHLLATYEVVAPATEEIPLGLREDLVRFRTELLSALTDSGQDFPTPKLDLGVTYLMIQIWTRLYGHVTLEVFGNQPIALSDPEILFDAMLADLARQAGFAPGR